MPSDRRVVGGSGVPIDGLSCLLGCRVVNRRVRVCGRVAGILAAGVVALTVCAVATGSVARGLRSAELPHLLKAGPLNRTTSAKQALKGLDPEFRPKTALRLFLREGFQAGIEQDLNGTGFWKNKVGGYDVSAQFANPSAAAAVAAYFHQRSLGFCLKVCDVQIKDLAVPGIRAGSARTATG